LPGRSGELARLRDEPAVESPYRCVSSNSRRPYRRYSLTDPSRAGTPRSRTSARGEASAPTQLAEIGHGAAASRRYPPSRIASAFGNLVTASSFLIGGSRSGRVYGAVAVSMRTSYVVDHSTRNVPRPGPALSRRGKLRLGSRVVDCSPASSPASPTWPRLAPCPPPQRRRAVETVPGRFCRPRPDLAGPPCGAHVCRLYFERMRFATASSAAARGSRALATVGLRRL